MTSVPRPLVFVGPSLPAAEVAALLDADVRPPVRMGDIYRELRTDVPAIVVIDGVFHGEPSVWHRELLDAIGDGIPVYGAASMGALRAAELHTLGMIGHGVVFEWYRDGVVDADDAVALLHGPAESGYVSLSEPLVNIRATLEAAVSASDLSVDLAADALALASARHFSRRSYAQLFEDAASAGWSAEAVAQVRKAVDAHRRDIKREDARGVLSLCARELRRGLARTAGACEPASHHWHLGRVLRARMSGGTGEAVLDHIADRSALRARVAAEWFAFDWAHGRAGTAVADHADDVAAALLASHGMLRSRFAVLRRQDAVLDGLRQRGPAPFGLDAVLHDEPLAPFALAWAREQGIDAPEGSDADTVTWLLSAGPDAFGIAWNADVAMLERLQLDAIAAARAESTADATDA